MTYHDVIVIGSGIAALTAAEKLATNKNVIIFTKSNKTASNSFHAQGGIAAAVHPDDKWEDHFTDTLVAGGQHNDVENLQALIKNGPRHLQALIRKGLKFDLNPDGEWRLGIEGGHRKRRILHAGGDATGKEVIEFILNQLKDKVTIIEEETVIDLLVKDQNCVGVITKNTNGDPVKHNAGSTIIATGGCGQLFSYTSNDPTITGDGIAIAYRAGAKLADLEFIQFHPTLLFDGEKARGLISEAVRGEGAFLINQDGHAIMEGIHQLKDLAPRDVVARTIFSEMNKGNSVYLDISNVRNFSGRFPNIYKCCKNSGVDVEGKLLPVIPGAHFMIGGIKAESNGLTSLNGLYAVGEVACTGVHGANRIASNSLLEGIVFGNLTAEAILAGGNNRIKHALSPFVRKPAPSNLPSKELIQQKMMCHVGVVRNESGLQTMKDWLETFSFLHCDISGLSKGDIEIVNMLTTAWLITTSAIMRMESRGSHYRSDYPVSNGCKARTEIIRSQLEHEEIKL